MICSDKTHCFVPDAGMDMAAIEEFMRTSLVKAKANALQVIHQEVEAAKAITGTGCKLCAQWNVSYDFFHGNLTHKHMSFESNMKRQKLTDSINRLVYFKQCHSVHIFAHTSLDWSVTLC